MRNESLREYSARLKHMVEDSNKHATPHNSANSSNPLVKQLSHWITAMSPTQLHRKFTMAEIVSLAQLNGKAGKKPADHLLSQALYRVGFKPCRDWTAIGRNRRYWQFKGEIR